MPAIEIEYCSYQCIDYGRPATRSIVVVDGIPFYRSTGLNSGVLMAGTYFPFWGVETQGDDYAWFRKPAFMKGMSDISNDLIALLMLANQSLDKYDLDRNTFRRFATIKCLLISSLLDEAEKIESVAISNLSLFQENNHFSFWCTTEGGRLKTYLKEHYPDFYKEQSYQLKNSGLVFDTRSTAYCSYHAKTILSLCNSFLEERIKKSFTLDFLPKEHVDNLLHFNAPMIPDKDLVLFVQPPRVKSETPTLKKSKELLKSVRQKASVQDELPLPIGYIAVQPKRYTQLFWPDDLRRLNIDKNKREKTEQFIWHIYNIIFDGLLGEHQLLLDGKEPIYYFEKKGSHLCLEESNTDSRVYLKTYLNIHFLHNGQIIVHPKHPEFLCDNPHAHKRAFKGYNVTTGQWMVLKASAPKSFHAELFSLADKDGVTQLCDFSLLKMQKEILQFDPRFLGQQERIRKNIEKVITIETYYSMTFLDYFKNNYATISVRRKAKYILTLLKGLANIHQISCKMDNGQTSMPAFHGNIEPENIGYGSDQDLLLITNFDSFSRGDTCFLSDGYLAPEVAVMLPHVSAPFMQKADLIDFYRNNGQSIDLWNMALIFALILTKPYYNKEYRNHCCFPPFYFIHNRLFPVKQTTRYYSDMAQLKQKEIDGELERILNTLPDTDDGKILFTLWSIVAAMLKVDPDKRMRASVSASILEQQIEDNFCMDPALVMSSNVPSSLCSSSSAS